MTEARLLSNARLAHLCRENNTLYQENRTSDSQFCFELLRRAIFRIDEADQLIYNIYKPWLCAKIRSFQQYSSDEIEDIFQESLSRFFQYVTPETWSKFSNLPQLLGYMSKCCRAAVLNYQRVTTRRLMFEEAFPEGESNISPMDVTRPTERKIAWQQLQEQIWNCVKRNCKDVDDYFLAKQVWIYGLTPRELVRQFANRFPELKEVYKRKRNLKDRIKRDEKCQEISVQL